MQEISTFITFYYFLSVSRYFLLFIILRLFIFILQRLFCVLFIIFIIIDFLFFIFCYFQDIFYIYIFQASSISLCFDLSPQTQSHYNYHNSDHLRSPKEISLEAVRNMSKIITYELDWIGPFCLAYFGHSDMCS